MSIIKKVVQIPNILQQTIIHTFQKSTYQSKIKLVESPLRFHSFTLNEIKQTLNNQPIQKSKPLSTLPNTEQKLIKQIKKKAKQFNLNNITRTNAYLEFYERNPELHWALLAHLVSRNGGWNMTDLQGGLTDILRPNMKKDFFMFLESANALIFYDAFPQLLLYEECKKQNKNLFHLLPYFHVSRFMRPMWEHFFNSKHSNLITVALIINEQHYIEKRVIQEPYFKEHILDTLLFKAQEFFQITQVVFPFQYKEKKRRLAGFSIADFASVSERIQIGKKLYAMLFGLSPLYDDIYSFIKQSPHTGSRHDYWPTTFTLKKNDPTKGSTSCGLRHLVYSPTLIAAWDPVHHTFTDHSDWYSKKNPDPFVFFNHLNTPTSFDITNEYCLNLQKLYVASLAYHKTEKWM